MSLIKRSSLQTAQTGTVHLKDARGIPMMYTPDGADKPVPVIVTVYGPGSEQYRNAQQAAKRRIMELLKQSSEDGKPGTLTDDERSADAAELLADLVVDITGFDFEGQSQRDYLRDLFADQSCGYITNQINEFAGDWANFYKGAANA